MTNERFVSMYSIWTIMAFNLLLVGDFAKLNPFVLGTWTNERMIAINQDILGIAAVRIDGGKNLVQEHEVSGLLGASQMKVAECGGEPDEQKCAQGGSRSHYPLGRSLAEDQCRTPNLLMCEPIGNFFLAARSARVAVGLYIHRALHPQPESAAQRGSAARDKC